MAKVQIDVNAQDNASKVLAELEQSFEDLRKEAGLGARAFSEMDRALGQMAKAAQRTELLDKAKERFERMTPAERAAAIAALDFADAQEKAAREAAKAQEQIQQSSMSWTELKSKLDLAVGAVRQFVEAAKKVYEFGKAGAAVAQTAASFDLLIAKVGASKDLLQQLDDAAGGTIDKQRLMSATATLLAGAEDELALSLANATPRLLEIAKAAQKLNPSLGDTAFLYESIATGVKRASPMILDNLGLTIRIGEANDEYAASLGKTVEQLTAEEQKQALLNATLKAGSVLIEQAGGNADSATDNFSRLETATKNLADGMKEDAYPAISAVAGAMADVFEEAVKYSEFSNVTKHMSQYQKALFITTAARMQQGDGARMTAQAEAYLAEQTKKTNSETAKVPPLVNGATSSVDRYKRAIDQANNGLRSAQGAADQYKAALLEVETATANLNVAQANFNQNFGGKVESGLQSVKEKILALPDGQEKWNAALEVTDTKLGTNYAAQDKANTALEEALTKFSETGNVYEFGIALDDTIPMFETLDKNLLKAQQELTAANTKFNNFVSNLRGADGMTITITVDAVARGASGGGGGQPSGGLGGAGEGYGLASGGPAYAGQPYWVGERGPEPFIPAQNGRILSTAEAKAAMNTNYNLNVYTSQSPQVVQNAFSIMRAWGSV